jgi:hypothetical protein
LNHEYIASSVLMVRPANFGFNPETSGSNSFQHQESIDNISEIALIEFDRVAEQLRAKGIDVLISHSDDPLAPDCIFPNNCFSTHSNNKLILYPMMAENRRRERKGSMLVDLNNQFKVDEVFDLSAYESDNLFLEGTGSIVFDHPQKIAYAVRSPRTNEKVLNQLCEKISYTPFIFTCLDADHQPIYHTNVVMNMGLDYVVYYPHGMMDPKEHEQMLSIFHKGNLNIIDLSWDQVLHFCGNMLQLQNKEEELFTICSTSTYLFLTDEQKRLISKRSNFLVVDIPMIEKIGGGGIRCMLAEVFLKPRNVKNAEGLSTRTKSC